MLITPRHADAPYTLRAALLLMLRRYAQRVTPPMLLMMT